jgi:hypothetical protein
MIITDSVRVEIPTVITDKIRNGDGVIGAFKDVSGAELQQYLHGETQYLGVDLNEDATANEPNTSAGVAIKEMELVIQTTNGVISYPEFFTNTTTMIQEQVATQTCEFFTLYGSVGSNQIKSANMIKILRAMFFSFSSCPLSKFDEFEDDLDMIVFLF